MFQKRLVLPLKDLAWVLISATSTMTTGLIYMFQMNFIQTICCRSIIKMALSPIKQKNFFVMKLTMAWVTMLLILIMMGYLILWSWICYHRIINGGSLP